jgi:putative membrane protein
MANVLVLVLVLTGGVAAAAEERSEGRRAGVSPAERQFMTEAARGNLLEMQLGAAAIQNAESDRVRDFGRRMLEDHARANARLMELARRENVRLPVTLDAKQQETVQRLARLGGREFDRQYMQRMLQEHRQDVRAFERQAERGGRAVRDFAADVGDTLQDHLETAEEIAEAENVPMPAPTAGARPAPRGRESSGTSEVPSRR